MSKKNLLLFAFVLSSIISKAQAPITGDLKIDQDENKIYTAVECRPELPGGIDAYYQYLKTNMRYPDSARAHNLQGQVIVRFIVEKDGSLTDVKVFHGIAPDLDAEAVRLIKKMPHWLPGLQNNKPVRTLFATPVRFTLKAQNDDITIDEPIRKANPVTGDPSQVFTSVEQLPQFPGGIREFSKFLSANMRYPQDAKDKKQQGRVIIRFVIERDGSLTDVEVVRSVFPSIDAEALRVIKSSPKWKPGMQDGHPVRVQYSVPISFTL